MDFDDLDQEEEVRGPIEVVDEEWQAFLIQRKEEERQQQEAEELRKRLEAEEQHKKLIEQREQDERHWQEYVRLQQVAAARAKGEELFGENSGADKNADASLEDGRVCPVGHKLNYGQAWSEVRCDTCSGTMRIGSWFYLCRLCGWGSCERCEAPAAEEDDPCLEEAQMPEAELCEAEEQQLLLDLEREDRARLEKGKRSKRRHYADYSDREEEEPLQDFEDLEVGDIVQVLRDSRAVAQACREAEILRYTLQEACVGSDVRVLELDPRDRTVKCRAKELGDLWFPLRALSLRSCDRSEAGSDDARHQPTPWPSAPQTLQPSDRRVQSFSSSLPALPPAGPARPAKEISATSISIGDEVVALEVMLLRSKPGIGSPEVAKLHADEPCVVLNTGGGKDGRRIQVMHMRSGNVGWISSVTTAGKPLIRFTGGIHDVPSLPAIEDSARSNCTAIVSMPSIEDVLRKIEMDEETDEREPCRQDSKLDEAMADPFVTEVRGWDDQKVAEWAVGLIPEEFRTIDNLCAIDDMFGNVSGDMLLDVERTVIETKSGYLPNAVLTFILAGLDELQALKSRPELGRERAADPLATGGSGSVQELLAIIDKEQEAEDAWSAFASLGRGAADAEAAAARSEDTVDRNIVKTEDDVYVPDDDYLIEAENRRLRLMEADREKRTAALQSQKDLVKRELQRGSGKVKQMPKLKSIGVADMPALLDLPSHPPTKASSSRAVHFAPAEEPFLFDSDLQPGALVRLVGLTSTPQFNGQEAVCKRWDMASGRWVVEVTGGEPKLLKPENLELLALNADQEEDFSQIAGAEDDHGDGEMPGALWRWKANAKSSPSSDRPDRPDFSGIWYDEQGLEHVLSQTGSIVAEQRASESGYAEGNALTMYGSKGTLADGIIRWANGDMWTRPTVDNDDIVETSRPSCNNEPAADAGLWRVREAMVFIMPRADPSQGPSDKLAALGRGELVRGNPVNIQGNDWLRVDYEGVEAWVLIDGRAVGRPGQRFLELAGGDERI